MRGSRPVLGGAEGEIPSVYPPLKIKVFSSFWKEVTFRRILVFFYSTPLPYQQAILIHSQGIFLDEG